MITSGTPFLFKKRSKDNTGDFVKFCPVNYKLRILLSILKKAPIGTVKPAIQLRSNLNTSSFIFQLPLLKMSLGEAGGNKREQHGAVR